jgi:hypothetical protein
MTVTLLNGPDLAADERGVHIIFVPDDVVPCGSPSNPTENELKEVAKHIGKPAPTDVIVFGGNPLHFAGEKLKKHPNVHKTNPETVLKLYRSTHDRAVWWSEKDFQINKFEQETPGDDKKAKEPFDQIPPTERQNSLGGAIFVARSGVPVSQAYGQEYKMTFKMDGRTIDPNMDCVNG